MSKTFVLVHPDHGEVTVDEAQWNSKFPEGEASHGWCEAEATARGWTIKGEESETEGDPSKPKRGRPAKPKAE